MMDARQAIYHYCNYQERCQQEVRNKLYELGGLRDDVEAMIAELIEKDLLNEQRYAKAIARGKFRMNQWGKVKIIQHLKRNRISDYCINAALKEIDSEEYQSTLQKLSEKKWQLLKSEKNLFTKKAKTFQYLQQKGFESSGVTDIINQLISKEY